MKPAIYDFESFLAALDESDTGRRVGNFCAYKLPFTVGVAVTCVLVLFLGVYYFFRYHVPNMWRWLIDRVSQ